MTGERCKCEHETHVPNTAIGMTRVECAVCNRLIRWEKLGHGKNLQCDEIPVSSSQIIEEIGSPETWLYVSKKLDCQWLPNHPLWRGLVVSLAESVYYRLTAAVFVWLELAGRELEAKAMSTKKLDGVNAYIEHIKPVWEFAERHLSVDAVREVRKRGVPQLPEHGGAK